MAAFPTETVAVNLVYCGPIDVNNVWRIPILCGLIKKCPLCRYIVRKTNMTQSMTVITSLHEYSVLSSFSIDIVYQLSTHLHSLIYIYLVWGAQIWSTETFYITQNISHTQCPHPTPQTFYWHILDQGIATVQYDWDEQRENSGDDGCPCFYRA